MVLCSSTSTLGDKSPKSLCWLPDISVQCSIFCNLTWTHVYGFSTICALHSDLNAFSWCSIGKLGLQGETGNDASYLWLLFLNSICSRINDSKHIVDMFFLWLLKCNFSCKSDMYPEEEVGKWGENIKQSLYKHGLKEKCSYTGHMGILH